MKIGVSLAGVSYHDGSSYRKRDYKDALDGFFTNVINPLKEEGHEVLFYLFTYNTDKKEDILKAYNPIKSTFIVDESNYNNLTSGDRLPNGIRMMTLTTVNALNELIDEDLDMVISTRFDISFDKNPFKEYKYDFSKCNFLWREPEFTEIPIVCDTFIVFPHSMTENLIQSYIEMETNPSHGVQPGNHNIYIPMCNQVGYENVKILCDDFKASHNNDLYKLTRTE